MEKKNENLKKKILKLDTYRWVASSLHSETLFYFRVHSKYLYDFLSYESVV